MEQKKNYESTWLPNIGKTKYNPLNRRHWAIYDFYFKDSLNLEKNEL